MTKDTYVSPSLKTLATVAALGVGLAAAMPAHAADGEGAPATISPLTFSIGAAATTDYVFRGISQTNGDPAFQAWGEVAYDIFYAGIWGSSVDFGQTAGGNHIANLELDFTAGVRPSWNGVDFDFGVIYYAYPGAVDPGGEFNYVELKGAASAPVMENVTLGGGLYYSPDFFGEVGDALYAEANLAVDLPYDLTASGAVGYQWFDNPAPVDYLTWNAGLSWTYAELVTIDLRYYDTDLSRTACGSKNCDARFVASLSIAFSSQ